MNYICLKQNIWQLGEYVIAPLRKGDILKIKNWRNRQIDILRQEKPLTDEDQKKYYENVISPSFSSEKPAQILFSFILNKECIGYGGLVHINWNAKTAEMSYLVDPERTQNDLLYKKEFSIFISMIKTVVFTELNFQKIFTETYDIRPRHIKTLEDNGFEFKNRKKNYIKINDRYVDSLMHECFKKLQND